MTRIRRIYGLTQMMKEYHNIKEQKLLDKIRDYVLNHYLQMGLTLNGDKRTIPEICQHLRIHENELMLKLSNLGKELFHKDKDNESSTSRALQLLLFRNCLEALHLSTSQANLLFKEQAGSYVPFLSAAVNQAIGNLNPTIKTGIEFMKAIQPPAPTHAVQVNMGLRGSVPAEKAIGPNEAVIIINQHKAQSLLEDEASKALLAARYQDDNLPEVIATKQLGAAKELEANVYLPAKKAPTTHETRVGEVDVPRKPRPKAK